MVFSVEFLNHPLNIPTPTPAPYLGGPVAYLGGPVNWLGTWFIKNSGLITCASPP